MKNYYLIVIIVFFNIQAWTQIVLEPDLTQAFEKAKSTQKDLLVYVINHECRKNPNCVGHQWIDSLFKKTKIVEAINQNFLVYELNGESEQIEDKILISNISTLYHSSLYFFSPDRERFAQFEIKTIEPDPSLGLIIRDTVAKYRAMIPQRKALKQKIMSGQGNLEEIQYLMRLNNKIGITDPDLYDHYLLQNGTLNKDLLEEIRWCECIKMDSHFFQTLLKAKDYIGWYFLHSLAYEQVSLAIIDQDSARFERALGYFARTKFSVPDDNGGVALLNPHKSERANEILQFRYSFALKTKNIKHIHFYAEKQVQLLQQSYGKRKKDYNLRLTRLADKAEKLNPGDPKIKKAERKIQNDKRFDEQEASIYNSIAWSIFGNVQDQSILQKALAWSEKSLEWKRTPELLDTYANLLFVLGKKEEAVQHQREAIELLRSTYQEYKVPEYQKTLEKFLKE